MSTAVASSRVCRRVLPFVLLALASGCKDDKRPSSPPSPPDASVDGGRVAENPDASWAANSLITPQSCQESAGCTGSYCTRACETIKCALDLDCNAGSYCALGVCTQDCSAMAPCAGGASCGARGRCLPLAAKSDVMPPPPSARQGTLSVGPALLDFAPGESSKKLSLKVSGLSAQAPFKYRVETRSHRLQVGTLAPQTLQADASGNVAVDIEIRVSGETSEAPLEASSLAIISEAGSLNVPVTIRPNPFGTFAGSVRVASPVPLGNVPFSFRLWPSPTGAVTEAVVEILADGSVLFPTGRVVPGTFDRASGRLSFTLTLIADSETWGDADLTKYQAMQSSAAESVSANIDFVKERIAASGKSTSARLAPPLSNPFRRFVGREIQVSLTLDPSGDMQGNYGERLHGLLPTGTQASTIDVQGTVTVKRTAGLEATTQSSGTQSAPALDPNSMPTLPSFQDPTIAASASDPVAFYCASVGGDPCASVTGTSELAKLLACAKDASSKAFGLRQAFATSAGGQRYTEGYARCSAGTSPQNAVAPQILKSGCVDETPLYCAIGAYRRAVQQISGGGNVAPIDQLDAYAGLLAAQRIPGVAYAFMGNEYRAQAVRAAVLSGSDLAQPTGTLNNQSTALGFASASYYASSNFALSPWLLRDVRMTPLSIATPDGVERNIRGEVRNVLEGAMLALGQFGTTLADELAVRWRISNVAEAELPLLRQAMLAIYTGSSVIASEGARRGLVALLGLDDVRTALARLARQHAARAAGANPLGYDPNFVPISGSLGSTIDTNFTALESEYANSIKRASASWSEFRAASDQWSRSQEQLDNEMRQTINAFEPQLLELCGVAPPPHPGWKAESGGGTPVTVTDAVLSTYKQKLEDYLASCFAMRRGRFGDKLLAIDAAQLDVSVADAQLSALFAQVDIEINRLQRKIGTRREYLTFRQADGSMLHAQDMKEFDIRAQEIERNAPGFWSSAWKIGSAAAGGALAAATLPASAVVLAASTAVQTGALVGGGKALASIASETDDYFAAKAANGARKKIAEQKFHIEQRMAMRAVMEANDLESIDSQAQVQTMLTRQAEQVLRIQQAHISGERAALDLQNLVTQTRDLLARRDSAIEAQLSNSFAFSSEMIMRTTANAEAIRFGAAFAQAQSETFELLRALEYEINADTGLAARIFAANTPSELSDLRDRQEDIYKCFQRRFGARSDYEHIINVRRDILGISQAWRDPVTDLVYTSKEQFQRALHTQDTLIADGTITLTFETNLTSSEANGYAVSSTTRCNDLIGTIDVQLVGDGSGTTSGAVLLSQSGTGLVRSCDARAAMSGIAAYDLSLSGNNQRAALQAGVNAFRDSPNYQLASRPLASTRWELTLDPKDPANRGLNVNAIENVLIRIRSNARPAGGGSVGDCL